MADRYVWLAGALGALAVALPVCAATASTGDALATSGGTARAHAAGPRRPSVSGPPVLVYSTLSNKVIQRQPAAGSCHAIGPGLYSRPDPRCTPGALNPAVTQATIGRTICVSGWTATVRPPVSVTEPEQIASLAAYGDREPLWRYEYDHFVPLELGGATNDPRNLWPEPGASPNPKDAVELALNREVCNHRMTVRTAQQLIARDWVTLAKGGHTTPAGKPPGVARCAVSARYNASYRDYDVYVHSNQPDRVVTVTGTGGSATWHTDATGYADVYFHAPPGSGWRIIARVGAAVCSTIL
jgi:hypothetical protein